jgi:hypothetical protein
MTEVVITCPRCGIRQVFRGSQWEIAVEAEVWLKRHQQARHRGTQVPIRAPNVLGERAAAVAAAPRPRRNRRGLARRSWPA